MSLTLVTGASRGIGAAIALACARAGHDVVINYASDAESAQAVAAQVRALGRQALTVQADVADEAQVLALFARIDAEAGVLTGLVNNAGIVVPAARLDEQDMARWQRLFQINVMGTLLCCREAVKRMSTRHGGAGGCIVNLSSRAAALGSPGVYVDYSASKGAIDSLTVGLAREVIGEGVRVNGVRPGIIDTEIHASSRTEHLLAQATAGIPIQRLGRSEEVAEAVLWLLSPQSSYTVGSLLDVAGGR